VEVEVVVQDVEKGCVGIDGYGVALSVDSEGELLHWLDTPGRSPAARQKPRPHTGSS
jgi:hypothetical protein